MWLDAEAGQADACRVLPICVLLGGFLASSGTVEHEESNYLVSHSPRLGISNAQRFCAQEQMT